MAPVLQAVLWGVVQGITEFLPVSSSGHLILVPYFTDWPDQGLEFDLAVHIGTLTAIIVYFRHTLGAMAHEVVRRFGDEVKAHDWQYAGSFKAFLERLGLDGIAIAPKIPGHLYDPAVHGDFDPGDRVDPFAVPAGLFAKFQRFNQDGPRGWWQVFHQMPEQSRCSRARTLQR